VGNIQSRDRGRREIGPVREMAYAAISGKVETRNPTWRQIDERIRSLEASQSGSVFLKAANGSVLSIGGDHKTGLLVFISDKDEHRYLLASPGERKGTAMLTIGFQPGEYPRRIVVKLSSALRVAQAFFNTGRLDDTVEWTLDAKTVEK
jgi:hypothetical protein